MGTYDHLKNACSRDDDEPYDCRWYRICQRYPGCAFCGYSWRERVFRKAMCTVLDKMSDFYRSMRPWEA